MGSQALSPTIAEASKRVRQTQSASFRIYVKETVTSIVRRYDADLHDLGRVAQVELVLLTLSHVVLLAHHRPGSGAVLTIRARP